LKVIFYLPSSTCVLLLARVSMKEGSIFPSRESPRWGVNFWIVEVPMTLEKMGNMLILEQFLSKHNVIGLGVTLDVQEIGELINGTMK
jgi:hypothetical protein